LKKEKRCKPKGLIHSTFDKITPKKLPNLKKEMPIQVQEDSRTPKRQDQNRNSPQHIIIKTTSTKNKERILKAEREKNQIQYKGKPIKITAAFSTETLKARKAWNMVF
jgi:hypothetical protein